MKQSEARADSQTTGREGGETSETRRSGSTSCVGDCSSDAGCRTPYSLPPHFSDDWLNWWCDKQREKDRTQREDKSRSDPKKKAEGDEDDNNSNDDIEQGSSSEDPNMLNNDYRFVYMGPAGTLVCIATFKSQERVDV